MAEPSTGRAKRGFFQRAVGYLAADAGIEQFVDLGSHLWEIEGLLRAAPGGSRARLVSIVSDTVVPLRCPAADGERVTILRTGECDGEALVRTLTTRRLIDTTRPVGLLVDAAGPRHGDAEHARAAALVAIHAAVPSGSHTAVTVPSTAGDALPDGIARSLAHFEVIDPGTADMEWWPYPDQAVTGTGTGVLAAVARKP